ncbi:MAG: histidine kinase [Bacteroidota bacterium]
MKSKIICGLVTLLWLLSWNIIAQSPISREGRIVDSLKKELRIAKEDSTKIKLRYEIGDHGSVLRVGYWDSLAKDAHIHHVYLTECWALNNVAFVSHLNGDTSRFIGYQEKSIKIAEENNYKSTQLNLLLNYGNFCILNLKLRKGLSIAYKGLKLAEELKDKDAIANFNGLLGLAYWTTGDYNKALTKRLESLKLKTELNDSVSICTALINLGDTYEMLNDLPNAGRCYMESIRFFPQQSKGHIACMVYSAVGAGYKMKRQYDSAAFFLEKAYKIAESNNLKKGMLGSLVQIADNNYLMGKNSEAKTQAAEALKLCRSINFIAQIPVAALTLKKILLKDKNYKEALEAYEIHVTTKDSIANEKNRKLASENEFDYEFEKKENENKLLVQQNQIQALELRQNNYFLLGMGVLVLLVLVIAYLFIRQNKIKTEQQSSQLEQKLLRSQMNPHFIFNSLQAIQNFILKHDEKEAVRYLSSFASVTRNVLENSRMEFIPLKKEITLLENYLQLQKLRFKNRFDYEIHVDETIDIENTTIPPMLAQPFIENAVEHGFHDLKGQGRITVSYTIGKNELLMEIVDNGIGMKEGYAQSKQHQSLALEITKERVALMNKKAKQKVLFTIGEAFPLQEEQKGVKVSFSLPLTPQ